MFMRRPPPIKLAQADSERRVTCRYAAAKSPVVIGWWVGTEFQSAELELRDISLSGASAVTRTPPPESAAIWLRLNDPAQQDWVEATVIAITARFWRPALVRMKFVQTCPYEFFKAVIRGMLPPGEVEAPEQGGSGSYWSGHYWD